MIAKTKAKQTNTYQYYKL